MGGHCLTNEQILAFSTALFQVERSQATVEKYLRSVRDFSAIWTVGPSQKVSFWIGKILCGGAGTRPPPSTLLWQP